MILVRLGGEISTKARGTRRRFQRRLVKNLRDALQSVGADARVMPAWSRMYIEPASLEAVAAVSRVFGVQSCSPVTEYPAADLDEVVSLGTAHFQAAVRGRRFAVRARVTQGTGRPWGFRARDVEIALGAALLPGAAGVDLTRPEVTARLELRDDRAYLFDQVVMGPGGFPLGTQDSAVALVSGGFDSAVAAWSVMRRGVRLDYVFCNLGGELHRRGATAVVQHLARDWSYGTEPRLHSLDFAPLAAEIRQKVRPRFVQLVLKRQMLRAAGRVAADTGALAIVTGDAIGQVSSQTLKNLGAMEGVVALPVLRPLLTMEKSEIVAAARRIGTHDISAQVAEHCSLEAGNPATGAAPEVVAAQEELLDPMLLERALAERSVSRLRGPVSVPTVDPTEIDHVPEGAFVVDVRSKSGFDAWHFPGARHAPFPQILERLDDFASGRVYVFYCPVGARSSLLAELLTRRGIEAYSFRGGTAGLVAWAAAQGVSVPATPTGAAWQ